MPDLPTDWTALCAIVLLLGIRHGFDADHLAAIDGLARLNARHARGWARYCGAWFSIGHGVIVLGIAAAVGRSSERWAAPLWLDAFGAWTSIAFLLLLGIVNLRAVMTTAPGHLVPLVGLRGGARLAQWLPARSPLGVAAVGVLFALSFDTISQAALFAVTSMHYGGLAHALALALLFVAGMVIADGLNGWWISHLIARADQIAALASRILSVAVSGVSMLVAALGMARLLWPAIDTWSQGKELVFGGVVVGVIAIGYRVALALARATRRDRPATLS